jgi:hypothetical protein
VQVYVKGIAPRAVGDFMMNRCGWDKLELAKYRGIVRFTGKGWLTGGESEEEVHNFIYRVLKQMNPNALISTEWTCLEDPPYTEYGDKFNADTPLPCDAKKPQEAKQNNR